MKNKYEDSGSQVPHQSYDWKELGCQFCDISQQILVLNEFAYVIWDMFPVTQLHTLVIPKRHVASYFELEYPEIEACHKLLALMKTDIIYQDSHVQGFNIGINDGVIAGQTIFHCHIHLIPRRMGDVLNPRGGVRNVIPGKGNYYADIEKE